MNFLTLLKLKLQGRTWKVNGLRVIDDRRQGTVRIIKWNKQ